MHHEKELNVKGRIDWVEVLLNVCVVLGLLVVLFF